MDGIKLISNFAYTGEGFLDERQGLVKSLEDLKNWATAVPNGFEVYFDSTWYTYDADNEDDLVLGFFRERKGEGSGSGLINYLDGGEVESVYGSVEDYDCGEI